MAGEREVQQSRLRLHWSHLLIQSPPVLRRPFDKSMPTWTILQHNGSNHIGLWLNALCPQQMTLITSDCAAQPRARAAAASRRGAQPCAQPCAQPRERRAPTGATRRHGTRRSSGGCGGGCCLACGDGDAGRCAWRALPPRGWGSRRRDCHSAAPPSPFRRCFNTQ